MTKVKHTYEHILIHTYIHTYMHIMMYVYIYIYPIMYICYILKSHLKLNASATLHIPYRGGSRILQSRGLKAMIIAIIHIIIFKQSALYPTESY